jgi:hypothetical protein
VSRKCAGDVLAGWTSFLSTLLTLRTTLLLFTKMETMSRAATKAAQLLNVRVWLPGLCKQCQKSRRMLRQASGNEPSTKVFKIYVYVYIYVVIFSYNTHTRTRTHTHILHMLSLDFEIGKRLEPSNFTYTGTAYK